MLFHSKHLCKHLPQSFRFLPMSFTSSLSEALEAGLPGVGLPPPPVHELRHGQHVAGRVQQRHRRQAPQAMLALREHHISHSSHNVIQSSNHRNVITIRS